MSTFQVNRGSTLRVNFNWPDGNGGNADFTGYSVGVYYPDSEIDGKLTFTLTDPATAAVELFISDEDVATLSEGRNYSFRIGYEQPNGDTQTSNQLALTIV